MFNVQKPASPRPKVSAYPRIARKKQKRKKEALILLANHIESNYRIMIGYVANECIECSPHADLYNTRELYQCLAARKTQI
jgi:hypothetical protein